jgi:hypothetical protein
MDVSNSTGSNTDYRVMAGGAAPRAPKGGPGRALKLGPQPLHEGTLEPHTYITLSLDDSPCVVQFLRNNKVIAQEEITCQDVLIALVPNGRGTPKPYVCRRK